MEYTETIDNSTVIITLPAGKMAQDLFDMFHGYCWKIVRQDLWQFYFWNLSEDDAEIIQETKQILEAGDYKRKVQ